MLRTLTIAAVALAAFTLLVSAGESWSRHAAGHDTAPYAQQAHSQVSLSGSKRG